MAIPVILPRQGQSVESCIITDLYKSVGDSIQKGEILFAYETDKASFEEEAPESGTILAIFYEIGDEVPVLTNIMVIGNLGESFEQYKPDKNSSSITNNSEEKALTFEIKNENSIEKSELNPTINSGKQIISPRAKNLAYRKRIDLTRIVGTGPKGRIIEKDILNAAKKGYKLTPLAQKKIELLNLVTPDKGTGFGGKITSKDLIEKSEINSGDFEIIPLSNVRKIIARAMHQSLQNSAQLTHHLSADATRLLAIREEVKKRENNDKSENITINDLICFTIIKTLTKYARINAHLIGDNLKMFYHINLGLAVDTERGLMVPTVLNADLLSIKELSSQIKLVAESCKKGSINPDLLNSEAASFTVTNLGNYGVEMFTPIINLPQVAILGVNTIVPRPKLSDKGNYEIVPHIGLSLTYDHSAIDGGEATRFLRDIALEIENIDIEF